MWPESANHKRSWNKCSTSRLFWVRLGWEYARYFSVQSYGTSYNGGIQLLSPLFGNKQRILMYVSVDWLLTTSTMSNQVRPQNWKALAPPIPNFNHQSSTLPRLPLPPLETTLQRLKDSLRPLARSTEEFASVCRKIDDFGRADGPGPILQQILLQRKNEADSWLEEWWDDFAFLGWRSCVSF